jgi:hypothetical protein
MQEYVSKNPDIGCLISSMRVWYCNLQIYSLVRKDRERLYTAGAV